MIILFHLTIYLTWLWIIFDSQIKAFIPLTIFFLFLLVFVKCHYFSSMKFCWAEIGAWEEEFAVRWRDISNFFSLLNLKWNISIFSIPITFSNMSGERLWVATKSFHETLIHIPSRFFRFISFSFHQQRLKFLFNCSNFFCSPIEIASELRSF